MATTEKAMEQELRFIGSRIERMNEAPYHHTPLYWELREKEMELLERLGKGLENAERGSRT